MWTSPMRALALAASLTAANSAFAEGDPDQGKREFRACRACHQLAEGRNGAGPSLYNIFGATSGQVEGFRYSDAMIAAEITWTEETLDAFIADPSGVVDGTSMAYRGLSDPQKRADLIAYLAQETAPE